MIGQSNGLDLDLDINMDALLLEEIGMARCTATPRSMRDQAQEDDSDVPWWVCNSAEPGCLFQRRSRHAM
jgi:hypothetical protein